jgi:hypothetical protein
MPPNRKQGPQIRSHRSHIPSIEAVYKGRRFRSLLETRFVAQLDQREIAWQYEPERIGSARYLVDFYLPDYKCWVEVKGRFDGRESLALPLVAIALKRERGERLFLYLEKERYLVRPRDYQALTDEEFWAALVTPPDDGDDPLAKHVRRRPFPRP